VQVYKALSKYELCNSIKKLYNTISGKKNKLCTVLKRQFYFKKIISKTVYNLVQQPRIMKLTLEKRNLIFLLIAVIALISIIVIIFYNDQKVKSSNDSVEHAQEVIRKSDNIFSDILNIESGSRGYILTGNQTFLTHFNIALTEINRDLLKLTELTKDNPNQRQKIDLLKKMIEERLVFTKYSIEVRNQSGLNNAAKIVASEKGKILTDKIRNTIDDINAEEFRLLKLRKKEKGDSNKNFELFFLLLILFIALILILILVIIKNQKTKNKFTEELKKSSDLFANLFNHNPASIAISRVSDKKLINVNDSFLQLFGFSSKEQVIGKTAVELNIVDNSKQGAEAVELLKEKIIIKDLETNIKTTQGEHKWTSASVLLLEIDNTPCLFSVLIDITNRKKAEEQLIAVNKELEAFSYSVSHDLRAPLRAINGYAKILQEDFGEKLDDDGINSLNAILKNSRKMGELIDDLLAFSRLGKKIGITSEINMTSLVKSVKEEEVALNSNDIEFVKHELLPAHGEQVLIKQVWVNLISNAVKYSKHKPKTVIEIGSYVKDNLVVYYIKDNGAGFDMQYYDKLFGVFQRLHSQEEFEGTGIGLAIVQKIINRHNGSIWAESKLNEGSCFYFSLPIINS
jgi:PAS domain S-box-containing protein